ncbi:MAG: PD-(D/E)XK nuclease family transposase, partial [Firmicutes bacterium]|nr:PD-(D/E)XK nuclease family transposase [Bacillota bacterium]
MSNISRNERRLALTNDLVFKAVYGQDREDCKRALIALLNLVLDQKDDPIATLTYLNPYVMPERIGATKEAIM